MTDLATSAATEWANLVTTAVLGTDRRPLPPSGAGWDSISPTTDPAVELLNRAAAVATARRAGVEPDAAPLPIAPAPADARPPCSPLAAQALARLLRGEHDVLLAEWFARCEAGGYMPPRHLVPTMLLRGRRHAAFGAVVRRVVGPLGEWLAEAMPELNLQPGPRSMMPAGAAGEEFVQPPMPIDSAAVVTAIVQCFLDRSATWAAAAQLRMAVASIDPKWLPALILELNRAPFHSITERTRVDLLGLAQARSEMIRALPLDAETDQVAWPHG